MNKRGESGDLLYKLRLEEFRLTKLNDQEKLKELKKQIEEVRNKIKEEKKGKIK